MNDASGASRAIMAAVPPEAPAARRTVWRRFARHKLALAGACVALVLLASAASGPLVAPYGFDEIDLKSLFMAPSRSHLLGTDELGHDVFTRVLYAGRISLIVGLVATAIVTAAGLAIGLLAGYYGGPLDNLLMRITDVFISVPPLVVMFILAKSLGPGLRSIVVVLCIFGWMGTARLVRAEVLRTKSQDFVEAAVALGSTDRRVILRHLMPNTLAPVIVAATLSVGQAILSESTISYFGLGIQPPTPSWGNMLQNAQEYLWTAPWLAIYPGFFIFITVLAFNLLGDGLRDALDPRLQK